MPVYPGCPGKEVIKQVCLSVLIFLCVLIITPLH